MEHKICVEPYKYGGFMLYDENDRTILIQSDWDFPGVASAFGWSTRKAGKRSCADKCRGTDGTVTCPSCGTTAGKYIASASDWLDGCGSKVVPDPGYFDGADDE